MNLGAIRIYIYIGISLLFPNPDGISLLGGKGSHSEFVIIDFSISNMEIKSQSIRAANYHVQSGKELEAYI